MRSAFVQIILVIVIGLLAYSNTLDAPFQFDDIANVTENPFIRDPGSILNAVRVSGAGPNEAVFVIKLRPVYYLSLALNYSLGGLNPAGYHIVNIAIHMLSALSLYLIIRLLSGSGFAPFYAALIFVGHPIATQSVTYISQRATSLGTLFGLAAIACYIGARKVSASPGRYALYAACLLALALGMRTKEIVFIVPVIIALIECAFMSGSARDRVTHLAPVLLTMLIVPLGWIYMSQGAVEAITPTSSIGRMDYLITEFKVIAEYLRLIIAPFGLSIDHFVRLERSLMAVSVIAPAIMLAAMIGFGGWLLTGRSTERKLMGLGIIWFFLALMVESSIIPLPDLMAEHRVYLPLSGLCITISIALWMISDTRAALAGVLLLGLGLGILTHERNRAWGSEETLWHDAITKSPAKARPHLNYGMVLMKQNRFKDGLREFEEAVRLDPDFLEGQYNLGIAYYRMGRYDLSVAHLMEATKIQPTYVNAYVNLGHAYEAMGRLDQAQDAYEAALRIYPGSVEAQAGLDSLY